MPSAPASTVFGGEVLLGSRLEWKDWQWEAETGHPGREALLEGVTVTCLC